MQQKHNDPEQKDQDKVETPQNDDEQKLEDRKETTPPPYPPQQNPMMLAQKKYGQYPPNFPEYKDQEEKKARKRGMGWRIFLAVFLTASITILIVVGVVFALYGDAIRAIGGNRLALGPQISESNGKYSLNFPAEPGVEEALMKFKDVYHLIDDNYVKDLTTEEILEIMARGLANNTDSPYTFYLTAEDNQATEESMSGEYSGIGAIVMLDEQGFVINDVVMNSPTEEAGVIIGDRIISVEGKSAEEFDNVTQLSNVIRGKDGTSVEITFYRASENKEFTKSITRRKITNASIYYELIEEGIGYIRLSEFSKHAAENFENAVNDLMDQGAKNIVIDLRYNGGGYAYQCIDMLDVLLPAQTIATAKGRSEGRSYTEEWKTQKAAIVPDDMHYAILLNSYSASASELFSGVLRDLDKATLVGERSYGKGVGTVTWELEDGSAVQVTSFEYFLPKGESIDGIGLVPDEEVSLPEEYQNLSVSQIDQEDDTQLQKAIEVLQDLD